MELTVGGEIDPRTGMVVNIKDVDAVLKAQVVGRFTGSCSTKEVPFFRDTPADPGKSGPLRLGAVPASLAAAEQSGSCQLWPTAALRAELSTRPPLEPGNTYADRHAHL